jgi:N-acetylglutamate synthase-like GNAT family acetyltransferase
MAIQFQDISIRTNITPGDLGYVTHLHGKLYKEEYNYGVEFQMYVAKGLAEFYSNYNDKLDRVWICEHDHTIIGFLLLVHKENNSAQLRYFLLLPQYRGIGLGKRLMELYMDFFHQCGYASSYLWTTKELNAAASLYKRFGFTLSEEFESSAFGKKVTEQRYDLKVSK